MILASSPEGPGVAHYDRSCNYCQSISNACAQAPFDLIARLDPGSMICLLSMACPSSNHDQPKATMKTVAEQEAFLLLWPGDNIGFRQHLISMELHGMLNTAQLKARTPMLENVPQIQRQIRACVANAAICKQGTCVSCGTMRCGNTSACSLLVLWEYLQIS